MCSTTSRGCQYSSNAERTQCILAYDCRHPHPGAKVISATKEHIRGLLGVAAQLAIERLIDLMARDKIPPSVMPVATGILIDKHRAMEGEPTQTIEVKKSVSLEDVRSELERIRRGETGVVEVEPIPCKGLT